MAPGRRHLDIRLLAALAVAVVFHGALLIHGSYRGTYDAYVHIFFADHYRRDWFSSWEPRWYTGFTVVSYPPGSHQMLALLSHLIGLSSAFVVVELSAICMIVVGVYRSAQVWVGVRAAGYAAIAMALSSSLAEAVHVFGQLPTTLALGFILNSLPFAWRWVHDGHLGAGVAGIACTAATTACHHVTTLFGAVFFIGPVIVNALVHRLRDPLPDEVLGSVSGLSGRGSIALIRAMVARRVRRVLRPVLRAGVYTGLVGVSLIVVVLPYWLWSSADPIAQIPIPHASRDSFLANPNAGLVFFLVPWGVLILLLPIVWVRSVRTRAWPLGASVGLLFLLGTGGTTPIPKALLGGAFDIVTLDRFTIWATIVVLPLVGWFADSLLHGNLGGALIAQLGPRSRSVTAGVFGIAMVAMALFSANLTVFRTFQPDPIDPTPIADFMAKDDHARWRYLTLGLGDQMAWVSAATTAESVDGNYHSARRLPELVSTPVERLEGAKFRGVPGLGSLQQFLTIPERFHLKFVFSNDEFYDPLLSFSGWHRLGRLDNDVVVWERDDVSPLIDTRADRQVPDWQRLMWGTLPMGAVSAALGSLVLWGWAPPPGRLRRRASRVRHRLWQGTGGRPLRWVEGRLERWTQVLPGTPVERTPRRWTRTWAGVDAALLRPAPPRRRRIQGIVLVGMLLGVVAVAVRPVSRGDTIADVVTGYYDDIDFRRTESARLRLDPSTRPGPEQWLLQGSVSDGLVASYAKLDSVTVTDVRVHGSRAVATAELVYVSSLLELRETHRHRLVRRSGVWYLEPPVPDQRIPPEQFVRREGIDFRQQGRRQLTAGNTSQRDILDRPEIVVRSARLLRDGDIWAVVGEVTNIDADPADLTVTAQLNGPDGKVLAQYNAGQAVAHGVLPGETVPFRVDFEGVAGETDVADPAAGDFRPANRTDLTLDPDEVVEFSVYAKAMVTQYQLDRSLGVQDVTVQRSAVGTPGSSLTGQVRNDGLVEATVPRVLLTYRDSSGAVAWVDNVYLREAIRPQRSLPLAIPIPTRIPADTGLPGRLFQNGLAQGGPDQLAPAAPAAPNPPLVPLSGAGGDASGGAAGSLAGVSVFVDSFQRQVRM